MPPSNLPLDIGAQRHLPGFDYADPDAAFFVTICARRSTAPFQDRQQGPAEEAERGHAVLATDTPFAETSVPAGSAALAGIWADRDDLP